MYKRPLSSLVPESCASSASMGTLACVRRVYVNGAFANESRAFCIDSIKRPCCPLWNASDCVGEEPS